MTYRIRNIGLAVVLALVAALLTTFYVTNYKRTVQKSNDSVTVLVAARDIPVGTSGADVVASGLLAKRDMARKSVVPGAITSPAQVSNLVATETILAGEQVTARRFETLQERGTSGRYKGGFRAVQLPGDSNQLLTGTLKPGDRVDVVAAFKVTLPDGSETKVSRTILRDIEVLDVSGEAGLAQKATAGGGDAQWAQLAITDAQAAKLWLAKTEGEWMLDLRPAVKAADSPENIETVRTVLRDGLNSRQLDRLGMGR